MVPVTGGANRKWGFTGKVETRSYERLAWLEHKADRYTTVYGYMGLGDRYEQHLF